MKLRLAVMLMVCGMSATSLSLGQTAPASGNGPYAAPLAATYADLTNVAQKIVAATRVKGQTVVIFDQPTFSMLSSYPVAVDQLRLVMQSLCPPTGAARAELVPTLDIGGAASGLAALITSLTPGYAIQGQAITLDNSALIAAFAQQANGTTILPAYLTPASKRKTLSCGDYKDSASVADLWYAALDQAATLANQAAGMPHQTDSEKAAQKAVQDKADNFQKIAASFLAIDKGPSALSKLLVVESLLQKVRGHSPMEVIDLRLDAAGNDSSTKTFLWWKWTKFNSTAMAHYTLLSMSYDGVKINLEPTQTNSVIILSRVPKEDKFGTSEAPAGAINDVNKPPTE